MVQLKGLPSKKISTAKTINLGTPVVGIQWPKLGTPQTGGEYDGEFGKYMVDVVLDPENPNHAAFISKAEEAHATIQKLIEEWAKVNKTNILGIRECPVKKQTRRIKDADEAKKLGVDVGDDVETGMYVLRLSKKAAYRNKKNEVVPMSFLVTDAANNKIPKSVLNRVANGSQVRVALDLSPYFVSGIGGTAVSARKIILLELKEYGDNIEDANYFDDEDPIEGTFSVASLPSQAAVEAGEEDDTTEDNDDF